MADRLSSGKKVFATSDVTLTPEEKVEAKILREDKVQQEITSETIRRDALVKGVTEYNEGVLTVTKEVQNIKLHGTKVIVHLFKYNPYQTGFFQPILVAIDRNDSGRPKMEESVFQCQPRGIIVNISEYCSEPFRQTYKVGDVVDIVNGIRLEDHMLIKDKSKRPTMVTVDNYFLINENMIEKGFKDNLGLVAKIEQ